MGIWEYVQRKARLTYGKSNYGYTLNTAMGTRNLAKLIGVYANRIKAGESPTRLKNNFMKEYKVIKNRDAAEYAAFHTMIRSPKKSPSPVARGRPPRPTPRRSAGANAMINKLKANLRNQIAKLTQARNHYQRQLNKTRRQLNAIP